MTDITTTSNDQSTEDHGEFTVQWKVTGSVRLEGLHCDLCGEPADSIHFVPWVMRCKAVVFACPKHSPVPEGYWVESSRWFKDAAGWEEHISRKGGRDHEWDDEGGFHALALLHDRSSRSRWSLPRRTEAPDELRHQRAR